MVDGTSSTERVFPPDGKSTLPTCSHDAVEQLGVDAGQNQYLRCRDCETVIVEFSARSEWREQQEALSTETREWNPLLDALRRTHSGPQEDPQREDSTSLAAGVRRKWRRFWTD
jgi:hypothetical protein